MYPITLASGERCVEVLRVVQDIKTKEFIIENASTLIEMCENKKYDIDTVVADILWSFFSDEETVNNEKETSNHGK